MIIKKVFGEMQNQHKTAWQISRPEANGDFDEVKGMDLPVNEFDILNIHIESTILEREIVATMRSHVMWAQTSRVQDVLSFKMHPLFKSEWSEQIRQRMIMESKTSRQDDYRLNLPVMSLVEYSISISVRKIIKLALYFDYLAEMFKNKEAFHKLFLSSAHSLKNILLSKGYAGVDLGGFKPIKILNETLLESNNQSLGSYAVITESLPIHLRAQLVRHRDILMKDNLLSLIQDSPNRTLKDVIPCQILIDKDSAIDILSKRCCWIAQYNIWSELLNKIQELFDLEPQLPCQSRICPFDEDAKQRLDGLDPNPPCPRHMSLNKINPTESQVDDMAAMIIEDNRPVHFWQNEIVKLETKA